MRIPLSTGAQLSVNSIGIVHAVRYNVDYGKQEAEKSIPPVKKAQRHETHLLRILTWAPVKWLDSPTTPLEDQHGL